MIKTVVRLALGCVALQTTSAARLDSRQLVGTPRVQLQYANVVGSSVLGIDSFIGVPFAQPPVGQLRLKPPQAVSSNLGTITAVGVARACPQMYLSANLSSLPAGVAGQVLDTPLVQTVTLAGEDCLTLDIFRPASATASAKLPVLFWIFGGGYQFGSSQLYRGSPFVAASIAQGKPIIFVSINYRVGGFGFLPGKQVLQDGASNLGLLDQRLALQWVADNIEKFGGDPTKVTIWGESAGAISVFDQMALYDGNNVYKGKALFRGAIMNSGSMVPLERVDSPKSQAVYDAVVRSAGCQNAADSLACLRSLDYTTYLNAVNSAAGLFSYGVLNLPYFARPDGKVLTQFTEVLAKTGKYAKVPFIIGDQQDEGTLFSLFQYNLTTTKDLVDYLATVAFPDSPRSAAEGLVAVYPDDASAGSPFGTGPLYNIYPQFKRLAAIIGDLVFTLTRRVFLEYTTAAAPSVPSWSYLATYLTGTPVLGTFHASDLLPSFGYTPSPPSVVIQSYYLSFVNNLDPNVGTTGLPNWPKWATGQQLLNIQALTTSFVPDTFRPAAASYLRNNLGVLHL